MFVLVTEATKASDIMLPVSIKQMCSCKSKYVPTFSHNSIYRKNAI